MDHFVSQVELIADCMFRWVMEESNPEPEEIAIPYLRQKGVASTMQKKENNEKPKEMK